MNFQLFIILFSVIFLVCRSYGKTHKPSIDLFSSIETIGINTLKERYPVLERPLPDDLKNLTLNGMAPTLKHYEVVGVGNLAIMGFDTPMFQMLTYVLTPFYKNIPLFSTDFILNNDHRTVINEIYSVVDKPNDKLFKKSIKEFKKNMDSCKLIDVPVQPSWYDEIRPAYINKSGTSDDDFAIVDVFKRNLKTLVKFEKLNKYLNTVKDRVAKYDITLNYVDRLIESGGVSTNLFKAALGVEKTKDFFHKFFFGTDCFKPSY
jgi:hypothetical protein